MNKVVIDFETRSKIDLRKVGAWRYSEDESTEVLCLAYKINDGDIQIWRPFENDIEPTRLLKAIIDGYLIEAHNAFFELSIWENICQQRWRWPSISRKNWRCSAAKCAALALPRKLEDACEALDLPFKKDVKGHKLMLQMCKPRRTSKTNPSIWWDDKERFERLYEYCIADVAAEYALGEAIPELSVKEQALFQLDLEINCRGIYIDSELVESAIGIAEDVEKKLNAQVKEITGGAASAASERDKVMLWAEELGFPLPGYTKNALIEALVDPEIPDKVSRVLKIRQSLGKTSVAKYPALKATTASDGRGHGFLLYHGATTGRWAGKHFQPQNIPQGSIKDVEGCIDTIKGKDHELVDMLYGDVMVALSSCIRGCLIASPGRKLMVADYAAIEARVVCWLAGQDDALSAFHKYDEGVGEDLYKIMAADIYKMEVTDIEKPERNVGKTAILGCGFGMGPDKFLATCASRYIDLSAAVTKDALKNELSYLKYKGEQDSATPTDKMLSENIRDILAPQFNKSTREEMISEMERFAICTGLAMARFIVKSYREKYSKVQGLWYSIEETAVNAIIDPGVHYTQDTSKTDWFVENNFLYCVLPSGRRLAYYQPEMRKVKTSWGQIKEGITFMGLNSMTKKWERQSTYGGKLVENITQATARDLMAEAMPLIEKAGYSIILSVHDELIAEIAKDKGSLEEFESLMGTIPKWAEGCPIAVEGWVGQRYRK